MLYRTRDLVGTRTSHRLRTESVSVIRGVRSNASEPTIAEVHAALLMVYPRAVFAGWSAAQLHGVKFSDGHPPEIWLPEHRRRAGTVIRTGRLPAEDIVQVGGRRVTSPVRTAVDLARHVQGDRAVAALDQCVRKDRLGRSMTTTEVVGRYLDTHPGLDRAARVRAVLAEADDGAESPWETATRLVVHRSGLRMFRTQRPIPNTAYRVDLGAPEYRVAVEFDGGHHRSKAQQEEDVRRLNAIEEQGWTVVRVTASLLMSDRATLLAQIATKLRERGWKGRAPSTPLLDF